MVATAVGAVASGLAGAAVNKLFAPKVPKGPGISAGVNQNITTPGFRLRAGNLERSEQTINTLQRLGLLGEENAKALGGLLTQVTPGFGRLTESRIAGLEGTRRRAIGDLRESLAKRRVRGSSFGEAALTSAELAFAEEEDRIRAESFLQELDMSQKLLQQQFANAQGIITQQLSQLNLEAGLASQLTVQTNQLLAESQRTLQELAARSAAGVGSFFEPAITSIGEKVGGLFGGGGTAIPSGGYYPGYSLRTDAAGRVLGGV